MRNSSVVLCLIGLLFLSSLSLVIGDCTSCCNNGDCDDAWHDGPGQCCQQGSLSFCCPSGTRCDYSNNGECDNNGYQLALPIWAIVCIAVIPALCCCFLCMILWQLGYCCTNVYREKTIVVHDSTLAQRTAPQSTVVYSQPHQPMLNSTLVQPSTASTTTTTQYSAV